MGISQSKLCLHCGTTPVGREELALVPTPPPTKSERGRLHVPVAHSDLADAVERSVIATGLRVVDQQFALTKSGDRCFGLLTIGDDREGGDYAITIGVRNSHDKKFPVGLALGSRVFVCDNLAFSSEEKVSTKHTRHVYSRLPGLVDDAVSKLFTHRLGQEKRINAYKLAEVEGTRHLHDLILRAYRADAIPKLAISEVIEEYEKPRHPEFDAKNLWSVFNAFTEVLKGYGDLQPRTQRLHQVFDADACVASQLLSV